MHPNVSGTQLDKYHDKKWNDMIWNASYERVSCSVKEKNGKIFIMYQIVMKFLDHPFFCIWSQF